MEFMSTGELTFLGILTLMSLIMITFPEEAKFPLAGAFVLSMIMVIAYTTHSIHLDKEFVLKRFNEGQAIECGLLRGERTLINPKSGWRYLRAQVLSKGITSRMIQHSVTSWVKKHPSPQPSPTYLH